MIFMFQRITGKFRPAAGELPVAYLHTGAKVKCGVLMTLLLVLGAVAGQLVNDYFAALFSGALMPPISAIFPYAVLGILAWAASFIAAHSLDKDIRAGDELFVSLVAHGGHTMNAIGEDADEQARE